jgi:redox-sensitive bicupin YhaK (pirin superfamily)
MIEMVIDARRKDLGGFEVGRILPFHARRMVGPFIFLDQMGPAEFAPGSEAINVRPHPHIGLSTLTYLFEGEIMHRDNTGATQAIRPGEVNWMTAGKGIVHSERTAAPDLARDRNVFGIQSWVALPKQHEETAPAFEHVAMEKLPLIADKGITARVVAGSLYGATSPVKTHSDLFYADVQVLAGAALPLPVEHEERGVYLAEGEIEVAGQHFAAGRLLVFRPGDAITLRAVQNARVMLLGGEPMDGPRHIWWNFVSSSKDRIEAAKDDWKRARFGIVPGDEADFIPLPDK